MAGRDRRLIDQLRRWMSRGDGSLSALDPELKAVAEALLSGEREELPPDLRERLLRTLQGLQTG